MKKIVFFTLILFGMTALKAQEIFFPTEEGKVLVYKRYDKKGKEAETMKYTIKNILVEGDNMEITYLIESMDSKKEVGLSEEITLIKKGNVMYFDMGNFINKAVFQEGGKESSDSQIEIKGNSMEIPVDPKPGTSLPDANVEMAMKMGFINLKLSTNIINRRVEAIEDIAVPAGSFQCFKLTGDIIATVMGKKANSSTAEWYAKGVGVVKSETYDKNGKLDSYIQLEEVK